MIPLFLLFLSGFLICNCSHVNREGDLSFIKKERVEFAAHRSLPFELAREVLALDPDRLTERDVKEVLSRCPAPRILAFDGGIPIVSMKSFAKFLILMGYPEGSVRNPQNGSYSYTSHGNSREMAGTIAWYYEKEGLMPMLIGHSYGGMLTVKILHELAGTFHDKIAVWNPYSGKPEDREEIVDFISGKEHPVIGLKLGFASAIGTGKFMRYVLGQWNMVDRIRRIPDTVEEFTGFHIKYDLFSQGGPYVPLGSAVVRNVMLPGEYSHIGVPLTEGLAKNVQARQWIDAYTPGDGAAAPPAGMAVESMNIILAADLWYSIRKHWCTELERWILADRRRKQETGFER